MLSRCFSKAVGVLMVLATTTGALYLGAIIAHRVHVVHQASIDIPVGPENIAGIGDNTEHPTAQPDTLKVEYTPA